MDRMRVPTEFGFTTPSYIPPDRPRPVWKTLVFGALLSLIPFVGAAIGAVYIDRRQIPSTYDVFDALKTALIQIVAVALFLFVLWFIFGFIFGITFEVNPRLTGPTI